jgi:hypothetical protein
LILAFVLETFVLLDAAEEAEALNFFALNVALFTAWGGHSVA